MSKPNAQEDVNKGDLTKKILFSAYGLVKKEDTLRAECEDWNAPEDRLDNAIV